MTVLLSCQGTIKQKELGGHSRGKKMKEKVTKKTCMLRCGGLALDRSIISDDERVTEYLDPC